MTVPLAADPPADRPAALPAAGHDAGDISAAGDPLPPRAAPPDPYRAEGPLPQPAVCGGCGAVYTGGTWRWTAPPAGAPHVRCPACRRVADNVPAGYLALEGPYAATHRAELEEEVGRYARQAQAADPLRRLMAIAAAAGRLLVTTTDAELAHDLAHELRRWHGGEVDGHFNRAECVMRMRWRR